MKKLLLRYLLLISLIFFLGLSSKGIAAQDSNTDSNGIAQLPLPLKSETPIIAGISDSLIAAVEINNFLALTDLLNAFPDCKFTNHPEIRDFTDYIEEFKKILIEKKIVSADKVENLSKKFLLDNFGKSRIIAGLYTPLNNPGQFLPFAEIRDIGLAFSKFIETNNAYIQGLGITIKALENNKTVFSLAIGGNTFFLQEYRNAWIIAKTQEECDYLIAAFEKNVNTRSNYSDVLKSITYSQGFNAYVNLEKINSLSLNEISATEKAIFNTLQLNDIKYFLFYTDVIANKFSIISSVKIENWATHPLKQFFPGAGLKFRDMENINYPADLALAVKYNFSDAFTQFEKICLKATSGQSIPAFNPAELAEQIFGFNIKEFLSQFEGNITVSLSYPMYQNIYSGSLCAVLNLKQGHKFQENLKQLFSVIDIIKGEVDINIVNTDYRNVKFSYLISKKFPFITPSFLVINDKLYVTFFVQQMKAVIYFLKNPQPVTSCKDFLAFENHFNDNTSMFGYCDARMSTQAVLDILSYLAGIVNFYDMQSNLFSKEIADSLPVFDIVKLPAAFELARNFQPMSLLMENRDDGIRVISDLNIMTGIFPLISAGGIASAVAMPKLLKSIDKAKIGVIKSDISSFNAAIVMFQLENNKLPETLEELVPLYISKLPLNPYGNIYEYTPENGFYVIKTFLPNNKKIMYSSEDGNFSE